MIINVASLAGINTSYLGGMIYSAVKAGVIHFTKYLNFELTNTGVRASVLIPGEVDTPIMEKAARAADRGRPHHHERHRRVRRSPDTDRRAAQTVHHS